MVLFQPYDLAEFNSTEFSPPFMTKDGPHPLISGKSYTKNIFNLH